jgi:endonuclease/exonuclease/phosphatase family metal-dependent hydrolase
MFVSKQISVLRASVLEQALSRVASDHLPLVAELSLSQETA